MIRGLILSLSALWVLFTFPALADDAGKEPYELVRELQVFQDQSVLETKGAREEQRKRIKEVAASLSKVSSKVWAEPRNARAAVVFVLSGGDPRILRKLVKENVELGVDDQLVKAALAYGEHRDSEAIELFEAIDLTSLDESVAGHVALVRALLVAKKEPEKALALLDFARLAAVGTIVEEAALRREAIMSAKAGKLEQFQVLASQYFRRFPGSVFSHAFEREFADEVVGPDYAGNDERLASLEKMLSGLPAAERRDACLAIAEEGIALAKVELVRFAARIAAVDAKAQPLDAARLELFQAAAAVVTEDTVKALTVLNSIDRSMLDARETALLDSALAVSREVRREPAPVKMPTVLANADKSAATPVKEPTPTKTMVQAQEAIAQVDKLLSEAVQ